MNLENFMINLKDKILSRYKKDKNGIYFYQIANKLQKIEINFRRKVAKKTYKNHIKEILTGEILSRYYYQKGRIKAGLNFDVEVEKALEILQNKEQYNEILNIN